MNMIKFVAVFVKAFISIHADTEERTSIDMEWFWYKEACASKGKKPMPYRLWRASFWIRKAAGIAKIARDIAICSAYGHSYEIHDTLGARCKRCAHGWYDKVM